LPLEAGLRVLGEKLRAGGARIEGEDRVGLGGAGLGQFGGKIELAGPGGIFLADDLAVEVGLYAGGDIPPGGIIRIDQEQRLDALPVQVFAGGLGGLIALPGDREKVRRSATARRWR
jgi:hypothetical protein